LTNKTISGANNTLSAIAQSSVTNLSTDLGNKANAANPTFTGVASFPDGSASAPSITNTGDTNTGLLFPADDTVAIATGGTERVRVASSGAVGIGTTAPIDIVHVVGGILQSRDSANNGITQSVAAGFNRIWMRRSAGTNASPTVVADGETVGDTLWSGHDGTGYIPMVAIAADVNGTPATNNMPGRFRININSGTASLTERVRVDTNGLITGTGTSLGAWTAYTPTLTGTWAIGNGTIAGKYMQVGKLVIVSGGITWGSTSTFGAAFINISLPVTAAAATEVGTSVAQLIDSSLGQSYFGYLRPNSTTAAAIEYGGTSGLATLVSSTAPFTWADGDNIRFRMIYQAA
jgi:hypothetical protein